jgi:protein TonB
MGGIGNAPSPVVKPEAPKGPARVSSGVVSGLKISGSNPTYPPIARAAHVSGAVVLHAVISKTGTIEKLEVISGPEMLRTAATEAVRNWRYKPYLLNGDPTEVDTQITVNFNFGGG